MLSFNFKEALRLYGRKNGPIWSAFLTYLTVLNIVPFFYFSLFILSHLPFVNKKIPYIKSYIIKIIPTYSHQLLGYFDMFLSKLSSMELLNSIIFSLSMLSLVFGFLKTTRYLLEIEEKFRIIRTIAFMLINIVAVGVIITIVIGIKIVIPMLAPKIADTLYAKALPFIAWFVFLSSLFYISKPKEIKAVSVLIASFLTTIGVFLLKLALALYFSIFSYSKIYGVVAIVPSILLWLFLLWNVILFGIVLSKTIKT
ncbi:YhjD/YihY/BrkB family envelope integrity protein [Hippea alviniae]|uniref:YhjD/YihY/BrkB family envelope integrity protein n=1 Tax=Hippea alviniae TaxID=1279027 RepID=UPI0003B4E6DF|nr:YhjD/YihY/BrkB family envelope integrity protein [Hippea alviniae]